MGTGLLALRGIAFTAFFAIATLVWPQASGADLKEAGLPTRLAALPDDRPKIAIVVDDLGLDWRKFSAANAVGIPLTLGILPYGRDAQAMLEARDARHEAILHLPMEPTVRRQDAGPDAIASGPPQRIHRRLRRNLDKLDGYDGVNNHTGSAVTADREAMRVVLGALHSEGLYFLDSRTSARSQAAAAGSDVGALVLQSDIFLDPDFGRGGEAAVRARLDRLEAIARENGEAIGIGHPYPGTLEAIEEWSAGAGLRVRFVTAGQLAAGRRGASASAGY